MAKLNKNLKTLARQAGGSFKTVSDRMKIADGAYRVVYEEPPF